ncbi:MAG: hypothetical protein NPIRA05_09120 [Nitrospirales bacterium]|nr:MAG: hypothetical protein NPIRA05_09120 [Nitrospirales bacterium]
MAVEESPEARTGPILAIPPIVAETGDENMQAAITIKAKISDVFGLIGIFTVSRTQ